MVLLVWFRLVRLRGYWGRIPVISLTFTRARATTSLTGNPMNRNLWLLAICQGLFLTNNVTFIAINGLVGLSLAPLGWMATLPVMGYVVGGALSTGLVAKTQTRFGRKTSFQLGLLVAFLSALLCAYAAYLAPQPGLEPGTYGLTVRRSTN